MEKYLKNLNKLQEKLKQKVLNKEKLDIFDIALSNVIINEYNWNPKFFASQKTNSEKIIKIFKNNLNPPQNLKINIEKAVMNSFKNKSKEDVILEKSKKHKITLSISNLMLSYKDKKTKIIYVRPFSLIELNLLKN